MAILAMVLCLLSGCPQDPESYPPPPASQDQRRDEAFARVFEGASEELEGDMAGAIQAFETAYRNDPRSPTIVESLAGAYARAGRKDDAEALLKRHIAASQDGAPECRLALVGLYDRWNETGKAEEEVKELLPYAGRSGSVTRALFERFMERDDPVRAAEVLVRGAVAAPDPAQAHLDAGSILLQSGRPREALETAARGRRSHLKHEALFLFQVRLLTNLGKYKEALALLDQEGAGILGAGETAILTSALWTRLGNPDKALTLLSEVPPAPGIHLARGRLLHRLRRLPLALKAYDAETRTAPSSWEAHYRKGLILEELDRFDEAHQSLRTALTLAPGRKALAWFQAYLSAVLGRETEQALAWAEDARTAEPEVPIHHAVAGLCNGRLGRFNAGEACFLKALSLEVDPTVYWLYSTFLTLKGRKAQALEAMKKAGTLDPRFEKYIKERGR